jgi:hypothetical protein
MASSSSACSRCRPKNEARTCTGLAGVPLPARRPADEPSLEAGRAPGANAHHSLSRARARTRAPSRSPRQHRALAPGAGRSPEPLATAEVVSAARFTCAGHVRWQQDALPPPRRTRTTGTRRTDGDRINRLVENGDRLDLRTRRNEARAVGHRRAARGGGCGRDSLLAQRTFANAGPWSSSLSRVTSQGRTSSTCCAAFSGLLPRLGCVDPTGPGPATRPQARSETRSGGGGHSPRERPEGAVAPSESSAAPASGWKAAQSLGSARA